MLPILRTIAPVFLLILTGAVIHRFAILPPHAGSVLNTFVYRLALPLLLFASIAQASVTQIFHPGFAAAVLLGTAVPGTAAALIARHRHPAAQAVFLGFVATFSNAAFVGLPVLQLLFPGQPETVLAMGVYALLGLPFVLTAVFALERQRAPHTAWRSLVGILSRNPLLLGSLAGLVVALSGMHLPPWLATPCQMLGSTASPLALIAIGMTLARTAGSAHPILKPDHLLVAGIKLIMQPAITFALLTLWDVNPLWQALGTMLAAMPVGTMAYVLAEAYGVLTPLVSASVLSTTVLSSLSLPAVFALLQGM